MESKFVFLETSHASKKTVTLESFCELSGMNVLKRTVVGEENDRINVSYWKEMLVKPSLQDVIVDK